MDKDEFLRQFADVATHLSEDQRTKILRKAQHDARIGRFLADIRNKKNPPSLYRDKPSWMSVPEFLRTEWLNKGILHKEIDRKMVAAYDEDLIRGIINFEATHGRLPEELQFGILRKRQAQADKKSTLKKSVREFI